MCRFFCCKMKIEKKTYKSNVATIYSLGVHSVFTVIAYLVSILMIFSTSFDEWKIQIQILKFNGFFIHQF